MKKYSLRRIALISVMTALAIALGVVESFIPSVGIPGVKFGLANILILLAMYELNVLDAAIISIIKIFIVSLIRGTIFTMGFYMSLVGGILSFLGMLLFVKCFKNFSPIAASVIGAILHVTGQILIAIAFMETPYIGYYLPVLGLIAIGTGILVGLCVKGIMDSHIIPNILKKYDNNEQI